MKSVFFKQRARRVLSLFFALLVLFSQVGRSVVVAQTAGVTPEADGSTETQTPWFRLKRTRVAGGAELLTVFGSLNGLERTEGDAETPLVSILRDTLGDTDPENDRLRYVWMLTYTRPNGFQRIASAVPFLYRRVGNKKRAGREAPAPIIDLAAPERDVWQRFFWLALQNVLFNPYGTAVKSSTRTYHRNAGDYRKAHIIRALAILSLYEAESGVESVFTPHEMRELQARLMLAEKTFGGIVDDGYLQRVYQNQTTQWLDTRGHNWDLLRQRAEAEGLYFEPLQLPDGSATHALLWVARSDLEGNRNRAFDRRFLSIASPWRDRRLDDWRGYTETRYFDATNRPAKPEDAGARAVEMIPLALYGLDHPKIPTLLVDFRDGANPKRREMSRRVLEDVARNLLALSRFGDLHYFLGRTVLDFVTGRRGIDVNQPSRLRAYSQLKLLLALNDSLDPQLRDEVNERLERVSLNPRENDLQAEAQLAREQYRALVEYAERPDGLPEKLDRDRRAELVPLAHGRTERVLLRFANVMSFGLYTHREGATPEAQREQLNRERRLAYHRRFLREVSRSSPLVEVVWNIEDVRRSLRFIAEYDTRADGKTATAAARIFERTQDEEARKLCLNCLYRINNETARKELSRIYNTPELDPQMRMLSAEYLRMATREDQRIAPPDAKGAVSVVGQ